MTNLKAVNVGMNKYCGPAVLSILTGKSTDECARVISSINGSYNVAGVQLNDLLRAADRLGFNQVAYHPRGSLYGTLVGLVNDDGMYIVTLPNHFVCIEVKERVIYFCDNHTKEPMPAASSARLLQKVMALHKVIARPKPPEPAPKPIPEPEPESPMFEVFGCYTSGNKLIAVFRNKMDADDYAAFHGLKVHPFMDEKVKWYVL